jgi:hypothetical protein
MRSATLLYKVNYALRLIYVQYKLNARDIYAYTKR